MTSPLISINGQDVRVSYDRWFYAQQRAGGISPALTVEVSEDDLFWFTVETVESTGSRWIHHEFLRLHVFEHALAGVDALLFWL